MSHQLPIAPLLAVAVLSVGCSGSGDDAVRSTDDGGVSPTSSIVATGTTATIATTATATTTTTTEQPMTTPAPSFDDDVPDGPDDPRVVWAIDETSDHFGYPRDEISVASIERVTWPTSALGCPATGVTYAEVEVPGYRITLTWADVTIVYHGALDGTLPFRCEYLD